MLLQVRRFILSGWNLSGALELFFSATLCIIWSFGEPQSQCRISTSIRKLNDPITSHRRTVIIMFQNQQFISVPSKDVKTCQSTWRIEKKYSLNEDHMKCTRSPSGKMDYSQNLEADISAQKTRGDLAACSAQLNRINLKRRKALNDLLDLKGNIRVFCRIRPFLQDKKYNHTKDVIETDSRHMLLRQAQKKRKYNFDKVFHPQSTQDDVFSEIEPVIKSSLDGYNVCIFAYGQTGTGKTFTMEGTQEFPGVVPRVLKELFTQDLHGNRDYLFSFSMLEIYMGNLRDLLAPQSEKTIARSSHSCLSIQTDPNGHIEIENLVSISVNSFEEVRRLYKFGTRLRSTASTMSNATSSRSHCLTRLTISCSNVKERRREINKIWMIDLGGSERLLKTQALGRRLEEGKAINLSLSALGDVMTALQAKRPHVPYRNCKLTQVLKDSLGDDSKMLMLVHVSPEEENLSETVCSLGFATRVRSTHLGNEEPLEARLLKEVKIVELSQKVNQLENECRHITEEIKKLTKILRQSDGFEMSNDTDPIDSSVKELETNMHAYEEKQASKQLPRFMRPTICSKKRRDMLNLMHENSRKKTSIFSKSQKPSSVYAEERTTLLYGSECGISRIITSDKNNTLSATECSQDASECEIKTVIFPEQMKSVSPLVSFCSENTISGNTYQEDEMMCPEDNNLIHIRMDGLYHGNCRDIERVIPILIEEEHEICRESNIKVTHDEANSIDCEPKENTDSGETFGCNIFGEQSGSVKMNGILVIKANKDEDTNGKSNTAIVRLRKEKHFYQPSGNLQTPFKGQKEPLVNTEKYEDSTDKSILVDLDAIKPSMLDENTLKMNRMTEDKDRCQTCNENSHKQVLHSMRSHRDLSFLNEVSVIDSNNTALEKSTVTCRNPPQEKQNTGMLNQCLKTIQALSLSVLLALGLMSLGFEHDFYHGLTL